MSGPTAERVSRISVEVNRQVGGYVIGNLIISVIAGGVIGVSLASWACPSLPRWRC